MYFKNILRRITGNLICSSILLIAMICLFYFQSKLEKVSLQFLSIYEPYVYGEILLFIIFTSIIYFGFIQYQFLNCIEYNKFQLLQLIKVFLFVGITYIIFIIIIQNTGLDALKIFIIENNIKIFEDNEKIFVILNIISYLFESILFVAMYTVIGYCVIKLLRKNKAYFNLEKTFSLKPYLLLCLLLIISRTAIFHIVSISNLFKEQTFMPSESTNAFNMTFVNVNNPYRINFILNAICSMLMFYGLTVNYEKSADTTKL